MPACDIASTTRLQGLKRGGRPAKETVGRFGQPAPLPRPRPTARPLCFTAAARSLVGPWMCTRLEAVPHHLHRPAPRRVACPRPYAARPCAAARRARRGQGEPPLALALPRRAPRRPGLGGWRSRRPIPTFCPPCRSMCCTCMGPARHTRGGALSPALPSSPPALFSACLRPPRPSPGLRPFEALSPANGLHYCRHRARGRPARGFHPPEAGQEHLRGPHRVQRLHRQDHRHAG